MQYKVIRPKTLNFFLSYQDKEEDFFYIPDYNLYIISKISNEGYSLMFIYNRRIVVDKYCEEIFNKSIVALKRKDIPWTGMVTEFMMSLVPLDCSKGYTLPSLIINIPTGDTIFHWDHIVYVIFMEELLHYLEWLRESQGISWRIDTT